MGNIALRGVGRQDRFHQYGRSIGDDLSIKGLRIQNGDSYGLGGRLSKILGIIILFVGVELELWFLTICVEVLR
jgi:hypothetical protein